ncbi:HypC/HybG/HupF family hydrogenase formation chaperone [Vibrio sp. JC009]|uniref:HypC/HybG/HupF family hydrogenase formation chaperone n=1 Tax=Vibrio sp. JC009 TaxID=2912314 RepID=UPI0023B0E270|nr:HypC/HybG/HupF family hydrogenase formation chaperone [Vibrio sp. JC009]WED21724.1 HypC/HybG/HupF family hydrogenase formation chaperone [Vibrio sp. JC009]
MCIGVPAKVITVSEDGMSATVDAENKNYPVSLLMLEQEVTPGDYLLIQVGGFAVEVVEREEAEKAIALQQALAEGDFERAAKLY